MKWHHKTHLNEGDLHLPSEGFTASHARPLHGIWVNHLHNRGKQRFQEARYRLLIRWLPLKNLISRLPLSNTMSRKIFKIGQQGRMVKIAASF
jgi:hypothetical protein